MVLSRYSLLILITNDTTSRGRHELVTFTKFWLTPSGNIAQKQHTQIQYHIFIIHATTLKLWKFGYFQVRAFLFLDKSNNNNNSSNNLITMINNNNNIIINLNINIKININNKTTWCFCKILTGVYRIFTSPCLPLSWYENSFRHKSHRRAIFFQLKKQIARKQKKS